MGCVRVVTRLWERLVLLLLVYFVDDVNSNVVTGVDLLLFDLFLIKLFFNIVLFVDELSFGRG